MRRVFFIFSILICVLNAKGLYKDYKTTITQINGDKATIKDSKDIVIGSSGIVIRNFGGKTSSIIARVDVVAKNSNYATLEFHAYDALKQSSLPIPGVTPKVGDSVVLNYLYDRALIVAPNYKIYKEITNHYKNITWVNPDIIGVYLAEHFRPNPDKKLFQTMCKQNVASLIFFALSNEGIFVDCNNFKIVKKLKASKFAKAQLPFYTRVKGIKTTWLSFSSKKMDSYSNYYERLLNP